MTPKTHPIFQHVKKLPPKTKTSIIPDFWITLNEILTDFKGKTIETENIPGHVNLAY